MNKQKKNLKIKYLYKYLSLFIIGTLVYLPLHFIREDKYPFMIITGGLIFIVTSIGNRWINFESWGKELIWETLLITILVSTIEVWVGFFDTIIFKLDMWTYENYPYAIFNDKTCLLSSSIWALYVLLAIIIADCFDYYFIKKYDEPPCYTFLRDKIIKFPKRKDN